MGGVAEIGYEEGRGPRNGQRQLHQLDSLVAVLRMNGGCWEKVEISPSPRHRRLPGLQRLRLHHQRRNPHRRRLLRLLRTRLQAFLLIKGASAKQHLRRISQTGRNWRDGALWRRHPLRCAIGRSGNGISDPSPLATAYAAKECEKGAELLSHIHRGIPLRGYGEGLFAQAEKRL